jgi:hypothetical protein
MRDLHGLNSVISVFGFVLLPGLHLAVGVSVQSVDGFLWSQYIANQWVMEPEAEFHPLRAFSS